MLSRGLSRLAGVARPNGAAYARHTLSRGVRDATRSALAKELSEHTEKLHREVLRPINKRLLGPLEKESQNFPSMPFVLLLGNHSSGKSTFINYVLGADVQKAGVAPTDDAFTVIAPAKADLDQDGPAMVGDPDLGFSGLRVFGTSLINHINLKARSNLAIDDIMLVDSPGMIDSPNPMAGAPHDFARSSGRRDRGYDFQGVARWFAERADVILLFFDPDKPGTTGETLECLTSALTGMDYKLHIILNKVDQFTRIHDFARAYGSLCWNLSKVIPRKDLPRIYTMCLPVTKDGALATTQGLQDVLSAHALGPAMTDLAHTREEVVAEVHRAPERRLDNMVTRLYDSARLLRMHARVADAVRREHTVAHAKKWGTSGAVMLLGQSLAALGFSMGAPIDVAAMLGGITLAASAATYVLASRTVAQVQQRLMGEEGLTDVFRRVYFVELAERDEFVWSLWKRVLPQLQVALHTFGLHNLQSLKRSELQQLDDIVEKEVPTLRRKTAALLSRSAPPSGETR
mmetsp:Transcript_5129/g.16526  ORF Transcript_5129/g.16526 Transcript_5129/m.16526 type:complete len:517 (-) Transcript_5129:48-1598(-)